MLNSKICFDLLVRGLWMVAVIFTLTSIAVQQPPVAAAAHPFTISVSPAVETVAPGQTVHFTVNVRSTSSHKRRRIRFHCANQIAQTTCSFSPSSVTATSTSGTSTLTLVVSSSATVGTYHFTVSAVSGSTTENLSVELIIQAPLHISVTVAPSSEKVQVDASHNFTATVQDDSQKKGVKWTLAGAGTLSATSSASGQPVAYTAPSSVPSPATVTLTATSVADGTKSATATITVTLAQPTDLGAIGSPPLIAVDVNNAIDIAIVNAANFVQLQRSVDGGETFNRISTNVPGGANTPVGVQMGLDHHGNVSLFWELWQTAVIYVRAFTQSSGFGNLLPIGGAASCGLDPCAQDPGQYPQLSVTPSGIINVAFSGGVQFDEVQSVHLVPPLSSNGNVYASCSSSPDECDSIAANFNAGNVTNVAGPQDQEYLFWNDAVAAGAGGTLFGTGVFFGGSLDGGKTFPNANNPVTVSSTDDKATTIDSKAQAVVDRNGNIDVAWSNTVTPPNGSPNYHVMFSRSTDQGQTFSTPLVVFTGREFFPVDEFTFIVEPSGAIDFGIDVAPGAGGYLQFLRSTDNGATFSSPVQLTGSAVGRPTISVDSCGGINVAWDEVAGNIFLARSADGSTFSSPVNITNSNGSGGPQMASDTQGHTYMVWPERLVDGTIHAFFVLARTCAQ